MTSSGNPRGAKLAKCSRDSGGPSSSAFCIVRAGKGPKEGSYIAIIY